MIGAAKSRQNITSNLSGFQSEVKNLVVVPQLNSRLGVALEGKESKINKSFSGTSTAAGKKQRQTLKGMIEGLNQT